MAEDQDEASKTEDPTAKRLNEARERGQTLVSQDVKQLLILLAAVGVVMTFSKTLALDIAVKSRVLFERAHDFPVNDGASFALLRDVIVTMGIALSLPILALLVGSALATWLQNGFLFTTGALTFNFNRLNPANGIKRIFSSNGIVELLKGLLKIATVGSIMIIVLWPELKNPEKYIFLDISAMPREILRICLLLLSSVVAFQVVVSAIDWLYQRWSFLKHLRMTKQEVKDEYKQLEGDPQIKARLRAIRNERARRRMMAAVPTADVVITNPTHYAVALKYAPESMAAPKLVAKGMELVALKIRELAEEHNVPIVENPPVARALHATVEIDQEIPPDQYRAVAEIISYVFRLKRRVMPGG